MEGSEHALGDIVEAFFVFAPELEVSGFAAAVGEDGKRGELWGECKSCHGDDGVVGVLGMVGGEGVECEGAAFVGADEGDIGEGEVDEGLGVEFDGMAL